MLVAQSDGTAALAAYRSSLGIAEQLAALDPANTQWPTDVAVFCSRLGSLVGVIDEAERRAYLERGGEILVKLESEGRLMPSQNGIPWFDDGLSRLPTVSS